MTRVLVVANRTASTPVLMAGVAARARTGASFTVLIPPEKGDHPDWTDDEAVRLLGRAAEQDVTCLEAGPDALDTDDLREGVPSGWSYPPMTTL